MPDDPTIKPGFDLHRWLLWREQPKRGGPFSDPQDAISELYDFGLEGITEFTGAAQPPGLLDMGAHVLVPETIERGRLELIRVEERHGAQLQQRYDVVLRARFPSLLPGPLTIAAPGLWQYGNLTFRLAKPAEFGKYIANPQFRPRRVISHNALVAILLEDEVFQIYRDKKHLPSAPRLEQVAKLHYPDRDFPRDNRLRTALADPSVRAIYGKPKLGKPPRWTLA